MLRVGAGRRIRRMCPTGQKPIFSAALTKDILGASVSGSGAPTFTRATVATVGDHEGVQRTVLASEARVWGARRVRNEYLKSQDMSNVAWTNLAMTVTTGQADPFGGTSAQLLTGNGVATPHQITQFVGGTAVGNTFTMSRYMKSYDGTNILMFLLDGSSVQGVQAQVNLTTGTFTAGPSASGTATDINGGIIDVGNGWYRVWISCTFAAGATVNPNAGLSLGDGTAIAYTAANGAYFYGNQLENVTGQSVVTPSEYVSTGVLVAAPYHGVNVDGSKVFDTVRLHTQNLLLRSNDFLNAWSTASTASVALNGTGDAPLGLNSYIITDSAANLSYRIGQGVVVATATGRAFRFSIYLKNAGKNTANVIITDNGFVNRSQLSITDLDAMTFTQSLAGSATGTVSLTDVGNGWRLAVVTILFASDPVVAVQCFTYMGSSVGLASYVGSSQSLLIAGGAAQRISPSILARYSGTVATINSGTDTGETAPIPPATNFGFYRDLQTAVTQLITPTAALRDLTNATWNILGATMTRAYGGVTGIDGVLNSASRLTAGATTATNFVESVLVAAASNRTFSCWIRRVTGTGPVRLYQGGIAGTSVNWAASLVPNQWVRCYVYANVDVSAAGFGIQIDTAGDVIDVDFAQFEAIPGAANSPIGTSFIPTGGGVRNGDVYSFAGAGNFDVSNGSAYVEATSPLGPMSNVSCALHSTSNEVIVINAFGGQCMMRDSFNTVISTGGTSVGVNTTKKYATKWQNGGNKSAVASGSNVLGTNAFTNPQGAGATLNVGGSAVGSLAWVGCLRNLKVFPNPYTDAQLIAMVA